MPTLSYHEYNSLIRDRAALIALREERLTAQFVEGLANAVLFGMVQLPMSRWPSFGKVAWEQMAYKIPTAAAIYKKRLTE